MLLCQLHVDRLLQLAILHNSAEELVVHKEGRCARNSKILRHLIVSIDLVLEFIGRHTLIELSHV